MSETLDSDCNKFEILGVPSDEGMMIRYWQQHEALQSIALDDKNVFYDVSNLVPRTPRFVLSSDATTPRSSDQ